MSGSARRASYDPYAFGSLSSSAARRALASSRDAMASTVVQAPRCIAGTTFFVAIRATPSTPHRSLLATGLRNTVTRGVIRRAEFASFPSNYAAPALVFGLLLPWTDFRRSDASGPATAVLNVSYPTRCD